MKLVILLFITLFSLNSCSQKAGVKGNFKLIMGRAALSVPMSGGAYVETEDTATSGKALIKLDAEYSAVIPTGSYNLLFVTFTGPSLHGGTMYCGQVPNAILSTAAASITVNITAAACAQSIYSELIIKIIGNSNSNWDSAKFDQGTWGQ